MTYCATVSLKQPNIRILDRKKLLENSKQPKIKPKNILVYENNDEWADGEVPWELSTSINDSITVREITYSIEEISTRDKIWQFLEEIRWKARLSGALKGMYIQLGTGDIIMNELESFDNCDTCNLSYDSVNTEFVNKARNINNYNTEFEILLTVATVISYQMFKVIEKEDLRNEPNLADYFKVRRQSVIVMLCVMLIFTKNIKNAV
jgi:hypothetical protein